jgi:DNA-directed RNA polymerase subunit RPC12/RpoP
MAQILMVKVSYHCISCKKEFNDMESASDHVRSTNHEIMEEKPGSWI